MASMDARFVMSRLVLWRKPQISEVVLKSAVLANGPFNVVVWRLDKSAHIGPLMKDAAKALWRRRAWGYQEPCVLQRVFMSAGVCSDVCQHHGRCVDAPKIFSKMLAMTAPTSTMSSHEMESGTMLPSDVAS